MYPRSAVFLVFGLLFAPLQARADDKVIESRRLARRSSVQAEGGVVLSVPSESEKLGAGAFGVGIAHVLTRRLAVEASVVRLLNEKTGTQTFAGLQLTQPFATQDRWAVHLTAGPAMTFGEALGRTLLGRAELGVEYRSESGLVAGYAIVVESALNTPKVDADAARALKAGDTGAGWRLRVGYAF